MKVNTIYYKCIMLILHNYPPELIDSYMLFSTSVFCSIGLMIFESVISKTLIAQCSAQMDKAGQM